MTRKKCVESECTKNAVDKSGKCVEHGGGKRCIQSGCTKATRRNSELCIGHGGGKRCAHAGCTKGAEKSIDRCIAHGGGKRCSQSGCTKSAIRSTDMCIRHGGGKRCVQSGCTKAAQSSTDRCKAHGGGRRCVVSSCTKSAEGTTNTCMSHGKRCKESGCTNGAIWKSNKCKAHGGGKRCPNCITWPDSRCGKAKYDGYCATCFKHLFPTDERSKVIYIHTKEMRVRNTINDNFDGFIHDKPLYTGQCDCTHRRRIDHRKLIGATLLCVETDEFAHTRYDPKDEEIRYDDLYMIHSGKWIFIRFNPDGKGVDMVDKLDQLIGEIEDQIERIEREDNTGLVEIIKMFY